jgi:broad specificity phosphatase PhoE
LANIRTIFIITRHGETESDILWGTPGNDNESITEDGKSTSIKKGSILRWIDAAILSSPLLRSVQSANIVCKEMDLCIWTNCLTCSHIKIEEVLKNPIKNTENGRYNSYAQKLFQDNTNGLMEFLIDTVSSSNESTYICVTHRDSWRHMIFWLNNLFLQEKSIGEKSTIDNDSILIYLFQWTQHIPWNLCFPTIGWLPIIHEVNRISFEVFWNYFYADIPWWVDLIVLHDLFLDFLDFHTESSPQKIQLFKAELQINPLTMDLSPVIVN